MGLPGYSIPCMLINHPIEGSVNCFSLSVCVQQALSTLNLARIQAEVFVC